MGQTFYIRVMLSVLMTLRYSYTVVYDNDMASETKMYTSFCHKSFTSRQAVSAYVFFIFS